MQLTAIRPDRVDEEARLLEQLAGILVSQGHCDRDAIRRSQRVGSESAQRLDGVLIQLGLVTERGLAEAYAELFDTTLTMPDHYPDEPLFPERLTARFLRNTKAVPLALSDNELTVAVVDPIKRFIPASIAAATNRLVRLQIAVPIELEAALDRLYPQDEADGGLADATGLSGEEPHAEDAERLKDLASEAPIIRLVNQIISRAVEARASDIHIEPFDDRLRVRYRCDGVLIEADSLPTRLTAAVTSRVKIMARMDIAERRLPQDGRIKMAVRGQDIDFRVSTVPSLHAESVVLRVLDRSVVEFDYTRLGLPQNVVRQFESALQLPNGIILVTGPTGSGKTTTLYTALRGMNSIDRKVITLEDPIEFQIRGIIQIQVKPQIDLTFASLLPHLLRQNPNVIMVGEIRDVATARIAMESALTGHLVLSTLHTNSAAATITRLRDMGVEDYLLTAVLRGVLAQRLVRRLCPDCRREVEAAASLVDRFDLQGRTNQRPITVWHAIGCTRCNGTGFRGRQAIAEFLTPDEQIERLVFAHADHGEIERAAVAGGMIPMLDAGLDAVLTGETTIEEVVRSVRADVEPDA